MLQSNNFTKTTIIIDGQRYDMEYELSALKDGSYTSFGNIYIDPEHPMEFNFFTIDYKISGYTPMNATKELIGLIAFAVLDVELPFE